MSELREKVAEEIDCHSRVNQRRVDGDLWSLCCKCGWHGASLPQWKFHLADVALAAVAEHLEKGFTDAEAAVRRTGTKATDAEIVDVVLRAFLGLPKSSQSERT